MTKPKPTPSDGPMQQKKRKRTFKGALATPVYWSPATSFGGLLQEPLDDDQIDEINRERQDKAGDEVMAKIPLLAAEYGIKLHVGDPLINHLSLILKMAEDFVPGFQLKSEPPKKLGRKRSVWTLSRQMELVADVEDLKGKRSCSDRAALRAMITQAVYAERWGSFGPKGKTDTNAAVDVLETRLREARAAVKERYLDITKPTFLSALIELYGQSNDKERA